MCVSGGLAFGHGHHFRQFLAVYLADFGADLWKWRQYPDHGSGGLGRYRDLCLFHYHDGFTGQSRAIGGAKPAALGEKSSFDCDCLGSGQQWLGVDRRRAALGGL